MENKINVKVENLPKSVVKLTITSTPEDLTKAMDVAFVKLSKDVEVKGFRKGAAPKNLIIEQLGPKLYEEAVNIMIWSLTDKALVQEKISPITSPEFAIDNFDPSNNLVFTAEFAVYPEVEIGDLSTIKVEAEQVKKAEETREQITNPQPETEEHVHEHDHEHDHTHTPAEETEEQEGETKEEETPAEPQFSLEEYYSTILEKVFAISKIELPDAIVERELQNHVESFSKRLEELGIKTEDYLQLQNITLESAKNNWRKDIEFSLKQDVLLSKYAQEKGLKADEEEVKKSLSEVYKPEEIEKLDPSMYNYVSYAIIRQKAFLDLINYIEKNNGGTNTNSN